MPSRDPPEKNSHLGSVVSAISCFYQHVWWAHFLETPIQGANTKIKGDENTCSFQKSNVT